MSGKFEIRSTKFETNPKFQCYNDQNKNSVAQKFLATKKNNKFTAKELIKLLHFLDQEATTVVMKERLAEVCQPLSNLVTIGKEA